MVIDNFSQILVSHVEILPFFRHVILSCRKISVSSTYQNLAELVRYFEYTPFIPLNYILH